MLTKANEQVTTAREQMRGGDGTVYLTALTRELPENTRLFSKIVLQPGCSIGRHAHERETELFYFIAGSGVATDGDREVAVQAGDALSTGGGQSHSVKNTGDADLVMLAVIVTA